jgi:hypothetical protein
MNRKENFSTVSDLQAIQLLRLINIKTKISCREMSVLLKSDSEEEENIFKNL